TALMTAFYMFRLMSMTFFGPYRGPAWETAGHAVSAVGHGVSAAGRAQDIRLAAGHGAPRPPDPPAPGGAHHDGHEVAHGPAEPHASSTPHADDHSHGHGPWHGPHESPKPMTWPLMALAVGAMVAGFVGIPAALGGNNAIEHFLEPSFTAQETHAA